MSKRIPRMITHEVSVPSLHPIANGVLVRVADYGFTSPDAIPVDAVGLTVPPGRQRAPIYFRNFDPPNGDGVANVVGLQFHRQLVGLEIAHGEARTLRQHTKHGARFKDVVVCGDEFHSELGTVIAALLTEADASGYGSLMLPLIRDPASHTADRIAAAARGYRDGVGRFVANTQTPKLHTVVFATDGICLAAELVRRAFACFQRPPELTRAFVR